ncbi:MAG: hypothetical protein KGZ30_03265 [Anaplasmataceae bacterium]|nr:hypothetical protein [Anaplasmataceae bacterium]
MKTLFIPILAISMILSPARAVFADDLDQLSEATDKLWRRGKGAEDGAFSSVASSMLAWGAGLGIVIALVAILIKQDTGSSSSTHCH